MSGAAVTPERDSVPEFTQLMGHPRPLWMLFMSEFWERFAFYGIRWAMVLYIVAQFHGGDASGEKPASELYGAYLALVYAGAIFGGYVADKLIGFQRSILLGAMIMADRLVPAGIAQRSRCSSSAWPRSSSAMACSSRSSRPWSASCTRTGDERRDSGFTIFYMGINIGALLAPLITQYLAKKVFGIDDMPAYKIVFIAAGIGMLLSLVWFWLGRSQLKGIGLPAPHQAGMRNVAGAGGRRARRHSAVLCLAHHRCEVAAVRS
jgi:POT family proton-dependent oligopeptide transporter